MIIANVPLTDFSPANGSTEFWLGTHAHTTADDQYLTAPDDPLGPYSTFIKTERLEDRRKIRPPIQPVATRGDITLRDVRLWHAGMPNPSSEHRIMLAVGYQVSVMRKTVLHRNIDRHFRLHGSKTPCPQYFQRQTKSFSVDQRMFRLMLGVSL